jgi:cell division protein ZipA
MKDWLTVIIVILILVILADGIRRMRLARRDKIRVSRNVYKSKNRDGENEKDDFFTSELPNGGARVVTNRETRYTPPPPNKPSKAKATEKSRTGNSQPQQASLNLDESVPMLMESVDEPASRKSAPLEQGIQAAQAALNRSLSKIQAGLERKPMDDEERIEPTFSSDLLSDQDTQYHEDDYSEDDEDQDDQYHAENYTRADSGEEDDLDDDYDEEYNEDDYEGDYPEQDYDDDDYEDEEEVTPQPAPSPARQASTSSAARPAPEPEEVLIVNVMTRGEHFRGDELLRVVLDCGMRFGDMDIFHRHSNGKGEGELLFSMANMVKPGTFDLDIMDEFTTPGVSLFMTLPLKADSLQSFELMLDTAKRIAEALNGELKDENRSVMTRQTLEHCRERIREFERRRLVH